MTDTIRTFIAADLPQPVREQLTRIQAELRKEKFRCRWVKPESIHLTLIFLGNVGAEMIEGISGTVTDSVRDYAPIQLASQGLGVFPSIKRPRVVWVGIAGEIEILRELKTTLDRSLMRVKGLKFTPERRPFKAHLTLGRAKGSVDSRKLAVAMDRLQSIPPVPFTIETIHVFKSDLRTGGAVYTKLSSSSLAGN